jgi:hypothetical protein
MLYLSFIIEALRDLEKVNLRIKKKRRKMENYL